MYERTVELHSYSVPCRTLSPAVVDFVDAYDLVASLRPPLTSLSPENGVKCAAADPFRSLRGTCKLQSVYIFQEPADGPTGLAKLSMERTSMRTVRSAR